MAKPARKWKSKPKDPNAPTKYEAYAASVGESFVQGLNDSSGPWTKSWKAGELPDLPHNPTTGKAYTRGNAALLNMRQGKLIDAGKCNDPSDNRWGTYNHWTSVGGQVRKGEKATICICPVMVKTKTDMVKDKTDSDKQENKPEVVNLPEEQKDQAKKQNTRAAISNFGLFHASQVDGVKPQEKREQRPMDERIQCVLDLVEKSGAKVEHGGDQAYYKPDRDVIRMPDRSLFRDDMHYATTLLHELGHWTGASGRLNREFSFDRGSPEYAREELRVEIFSFMCAQCLDLPFNPEDGGHQKYVAMWAKAVDQDPGEIVKATRDASVICQYLKVPEPTFEIMQKLEQKREHTTTPTGPKPPPTTVVPAAAAKTSPGMAHSR